jgi:hypothetical protein
MSREKIPKSSPQRTAGLFEPQAEKNPILKYKI